MLFHFCYGNILKINIATGIMYNKLQSWLGYFQINEKCFEFT